MSRQSLKNWRRRELPEADRLPPGDRWKLNEHIYRQRFTTSTLQALPLIFVFGIIGGVLPLMASHLPSLGVPVQLVMPLVLIVMLPIQITAMLWYHQRYGQRIVWRALNACDCRTCEACGYDCRATPTDTCPECGASLAKAAPFIEPPDGQDEITN